MRAGRKSTRIAAIAFLAGTVAARSPEIKYILAHGSPAEDQTRAQIQRVLKEYDLSGWIWTRTVVIDSGAIPHSHPRLTLHTRHRGDDLLLLSTFVHEQYHWYASAHQREIGSAIADLRKMYPEVPVSEPDGAADEQSSYLHIVVCYAEYEKMKALVGPERARQVMEFWARDHYRKIYRLVLDNEQPVGAVVRRHGLLPRV